MTIQLTKNDTEISLSLKDLASLKKEFNKSHCILLPKFIQHDLLKSIQDEIELSKFSRKIYKGLDEELCLRNNKLTGLLFFMLSQQKLFHIIKEITECKNIEGFTGRVYRFMPGIKQANYWHDDDAENRLIAVSINLSTGVYSGGVLQIRNRYSKKIIHEVSNIGFGNTIIFRVGENLEHRVTHVNGKVPKTALAGWFVSKAREKLLTEKKSLKHNTKFTETKTLLKNHLKLNKAVISRTNHDQISIFNMNTGLQYLFNPVGSRLWELLNETSNLQETFHAMKDEYDVSPDILKRDILNQVQEFKNIGLVSNIN
ncbi:MAG: PqqD family peptide modification chaperone [Candidatus Melainabacteria bacterium]|nr:PqqD family peptide modification chaperone [Candidatus Melainabacteria bacterium]